MICFLKHHEPNATFSSKTLSSVNPALASDMNWAEQKTSNLKKTKYFNGVWDPGSWCLDTIHWQGFGSTPSSFYLGDLRRHRIAFRSRWGRINRHHPKTKKKNTGGKGTLNRRTIQIYLLFWSALARRHRKRGGSALLCFCNCIFHTAWLQYSTIPCHL